MAIKYVAADWNGTLFQDVNEGKLWEYVGLAALKDAVLHGRVGKSVELVKAFVDLKKLSAAYKRGEVEYGAIYDVFNEHVLSDLSVPEVEKLIDRYAAKPETLAKVDRRLTAPLAQRRFVNDLRVDIISTGCKYGIKQILENNDKGFHPCVDVVAANSLDAKENGPPIYLPGDAAHFYYDSIYSPESKRHLLGLFTLTSGKDFAFLGDSANDEACMQLTKERGGVVIAPFFAMDDFKQHIAKEYGALVPETTEDFMAILEKA